MTDEIWKRSGKIIKISPDVVTIEYEKDGKNISTGFFITAHPDKFSSHAVGDMVTVSYQKGSSNAVDIAPKSNGSPFGMKKPFDPEADKRRQILIVRQSCLDRACSLWLGVKPNTATINEEALKSIVDVAGRFEQWVMRE